MTFSLSAALRPFPSTIGRIEVAKIVKTENPNVSPYVHQKWVLFQNLIGQR